MLFDDKSVFQVKLPRPHFKAKGIPNDKSVENEVEDEEIDVEHDSEEVQFACSSSVSDPTMIEREN